MVKVQFVVCTAIILYTDMKHITVSQTLLLTLNFITSIDVKMLKKKYIVF